MFLLGWEDFNWITHTIVNNVVDPTEFNKTIRWLILKKTCIRPMLATKVRKYNHSNVLGGATEPEMFGVWTVITTKLFIAVFFGWLKNSFTVNLYCLTHDSTSECSQRQAGYRLGACSGPVLSDSRLVWSNCLSEAPWSRILAITMIQP